MFLLGTPQSFVAVPLAVPAVRGFYVAMDGR